MTSKSKAPATTSLRGQALLEVGFFALALALVLWVAQAVQLHGLDGVQRWQKDIQKAAGNVAADDGLALTTKWCQRDQDFIVHSAALGEASYCRHDSQWLLGSVMRWISEPEPWGVQLQQPHIKRWQQEVMASSQHWRARLIAADTALLASAMTAEHSAGSTLLEVPAAAAALLTVRQRPRPADDVRQLQARANERLAQWDRWVSEQVLPVVHAPADQVQSETLWTLAQSLSGVGGDVGARAVFQLLKSRDHATRAGYLLRIMNHLPWLLLAHLLMTALATLWVRAQIAPVRQLNGLLGLGMLFWVVLGTCGAAPSPVAYPLLMIGLAVWMVVSWLGEHFFSHKLPDPVSSQLVLASWIPGWWLFTAVGWLLLLDQSLHFHDRLRFLALDQWWSWCISALLLPLSAWAAPWVLHTALGVSRGAWARWPLGWSWLQRFTGLTCVACLALAHLMHVPQYVTGEVLKFLFLLGLCAWCIWKMPITAQLWHAGHARIAWHGLGGVAWWMVLAAAAAFLTADKGPLLVLSLVVTVLLSAVLGWTAGMCMLVLGFAAIFLLGVDLDVVGERLQAWRDPFTANRDDMARLVWFQSEASRLPWGFGVGQVPWCGTSRLDVCHGLPLQLQSDYTFTALMGWWGPWGAWLCLLLFTAFIYHALVYCARVSPALLTPLALLQTATLERAWALHLLFLLAVLMLMQTWITVAGNLGWLPLTGVTWPLMSYGKSSLWLCTMLVGAWGLRRTDA